MTRHHLQTPLLYPTTPADVFTYEWAPVDTNGWDKADTNGWDTYEWAPVDTNGWDRFDATIHQQVATGA